MGTIADIVIIFLLWKINRNLVIISRNQFHQYLKT